MRLLMEPIDVAENIACSKAHYTHGLQIQDDVASANNDASLSANTLYPQAFCWRGALYEVECVLERWSARSEWWGAEEQREYFMLLTQRGVMEIFHGRGGWMLSRIVD